MFIRVVRFTGVDDAHLRENLARIQQHDGPPEGVPSTGLRILHDEAQGTAVVLQYFASADDMAAGAAVLEAMDPGDTPGTRASVDACEVKLELDS